MISRIYSSILREVSSGQKRYEHSVSVSELCPKAALFYLNWHCDCKCVCLLNGSDMWLMGGQEGIGNLMIIPHLHSSTSFISGESYSQNKITSINGTLTFNLHL